MMNRIWGGLILVSILFAIANDLYDKFYDVHENNRLYEADVLHPVIESPLHGQPVVLRLARSDSNIQIDAFYQIHQRHIQLKILYAENLPRQWLARFNDDRDMLLVDVMSSDANRLALRLPAIHWQYLDNMIQAGFDMVEFAARLALGLIGLMALWLGLMRIAEESGLVSGLVKLIRPVLRPVFPEVPPEHPAMGAISLNLSANMLGLGNAATPMGIKAMQHLQDLNENKELASNSMCMFLALNTSSVQLLPPVTVIALLGVNASGLFLSIFLATLCSTLVAFVAARWFAKRERGEMRK